MVPKYIELKAICTTQVNIIAYTGTFFESETLLSVCEKGSPWSLAKAYTAREPSAINEFAHTRTITEIKHDNTVEPATLAVELRKISITGTPVADVAVASMSPMQKQREMRKMNPVTAPMYTDLVSLLLSEPACEHS